MKELSNLILEKKALEKKIEEIKKNIFQISTSSNVSLNGKQIKKYNKWNDVASGSNFLKPYENKKEFLLKEEKIKFAFTELKYKQLTCQEKGHDEEIVSTGYNGVYVNCKRCNTGYIRPMTQKEQESFFEITSTPFTI